MCGTNIEVAKPTVFETQKRATCSHSSGRKWPQVAARASGRKWPQVAARGRMWPVVLLVGFEISRGSVTCSHLHYLQPLAATCSHLQPLAATRVAASGRKWPLGQVAASGRKWPQVAASGCLDGKYQPEWPHP